MFLRRSMLLALLQIVAAAQTTDAIWVGALSDPAETACVLIVPGGAGVPLTAARTPTGAPIDATVEATIVDSSCIPAGGQSRMDIWLEFPAEAGTASNCISGSPTFVADTNTDMHGMTHMALPIQGGGWSEGPAVFMLNGFPAHTPDYDYWPQLLLQVNSPDINGDRVVDLSDIAAFAGDYHGAFHMRSDLQRDGVLNLADIALMATHMGADCR
ncbi:MAG: hypothetical protein IPK64_15260 [bacterium]|nr:hypothetical protein [bacterium]